MVRFLRTDNSAIVLFLEEWQSWIWSSYAIGTGWPEAMEPNEIIPTSFSVCYNTKYL